MLFGRKKPEGRTYLLLDVESGSVGGALVRLGDGQAPRLFGETRVFMRPGSTRDSASLLRGVRESVARVLGRVADVAARMRTNAGPAGEVAEARVFLSAPWAKPDLSAKPLFIEPAQDAVEHAMTSLFGNTPLAYHTTAGGVAGGVRHFVPHEDPYLLCMITGEVSELLLVHHGAVAGYATVPLGRHSMVRTLRTHGGMSAEEAHSLMRLGHPSAHEASEEAARHYAEELSEIVESLLTRAPAARVYIVAHGEVGEWFARALSHSGVLAGLFPQGGSVRALSHRHIRSALAGHAQEPDSVLALQALYISDMLGW